jgi:hypothetical protein
LNHYCHHFLGHPMMQPSFFKKLPLNWPLKLAPSWLKAYPITFLFMMHLVPLKVSQILSSFQATFIPTLHKVIKHL